MKKNKSNLKRLVMASSVCVLSACGGGGNAAAPAADAAGVVAQLERQGAIPVLNRDSTIAGVVTNSNGIRDDVNTYISGLSDTQVQKKTLIQLASAYQNTLLVDVKNSSAVKATDNALVNALSCIHSQYASEISGQKSLMLEKLTINTKVRFLAYEAFNSATTGYVTALPAAGVGCAI